MSTADAADRVLRQAKDSGGKKTIACAEALRIAAECGVPPGEIGAICNKHGIKIVNCQLGCFGK